MMDREGSDLQLRRWHAAEEARDQLEEYLTVRENAGLRTDEAEREQLDEAITAADHEIEASEIAFFRAIGDDERVAELELARLERPAILSSAFDSHDPPDLAA